MGLDAARHVQRQPHDEQRAVPELRNLPLSPLERARCWSSITRTTRRPRASRICAARRSIASPPTCQCAGHGLSAGAHGQRHLSRAGAARPTTRSACACRARTSGGPIRATRRTSRSSNDGAVLVRRPADRVDQALQARACVHDELHAQPVGRHDVGSHVRRARATRTSPGPNSRFAHGHSRFHTPHRFTFNGTWLMPFWSWPRRPRSARSSAAGRCRPRSSWRRARRSR